MPEAARPKPRGRSHWPFCDTGRPVLHAIGRSGTPVGRYTIGLCATMGRCRRACASATVSCVGIMCRRTRTSATASSPLCTALVRRHCPLVALVHVRPREDAVAHVRDYTVAPVPMRRRGAPGSRSRSRTTVPQVPAQGRPGVPRRLTLRRPTLNKERMKGPGAAAPFPQESATWRSSVHHDGA